MDVLAIQFLIALYFMVHDVSILTGKPSKSWLRFLVAVVLFILTYMGVAIIRL